MPLLVKILLGLLALVVVGAGAATAFVLIVLNSPSENTAQYIPSSATAYFSVNLRPGLRQTLNAGSFFSKIDTDELEDWREERLDDIEEETGIHPTEDTSDWLGTEISGAILNDDIDDVEWVVMLQIADREGAEDFADDLADALAEENGAEVDEDSSDGLSLWLFDDDSFAIAVSDDYFIVGDGEDTVTDIAENTEEPLRRSLLDNEAFTAAREAAPSPRFAFGFLDLEALWPGSSDSLGALGTSEELREELEENWPVYISMSTSFQSDDVRVDLSYFLEEEAIEWDGPPVQAHQAMPSDALAAMSTTQVLDAWEQAWDIIEETDPNTAGDLRQYWRDVEAEVGFDLEEDVLDTLSGETGLALLPSDFDFSSEDAALESPVHVFFLAGVEDPETLRETADILLARVEEENDYDFTRVDIGEFEAVSISLEQVDETLDAYTPSYVVMDDWAAVGTTLESLELLHDSASGSADSLDDNAEFRRVFDASASPVHYFVYANVFALVEAIDDALEGDERKTFRNDVRPYIQNLSALMFTTSVTPQEVRMSMILTAVE